jgi:hypothetical protein
MRLLQPSPAARRFAAIACGETLRSRRLRRDASQPSPAARRYAAIAPRGGMLICTCSADASVATCGETLRSHIAQRSTLALCASRVVCSTRAISSFDGGTCLFTGQEPLCPTLRSSPALAAQVQVSLWSGQGGGGWRVLAQDDTEGISVMALEKPCKSG